MIFLSQSEIRELTGFVHSKRQVRWLAERGYKFEVTASGAPKVLLSHIEQRLGGASHKNHRELELDFSDKTFFG